jgi:dTDP-glucose pyrophosphorylase
MLNVVFPMMGKGSRFLKAGFTGPKYLLDIHGKPLLYFVLYGFRHIFEESNFTFVVRKDHDQEIIYKILASLNIKNYKFIVLRQDTDGQASSVYLALKKISNVEDNKPLLIFNIDTIHLDFNSEYYKDKNSHSLEVFNADGDHWSFVRTLKNKNIVVEVAEKRRISSLCSNGMYFFNRIDAFYKAYTSCYLNTDKSLWKNNEAYIAPLYSFLINNNELVIANEIDQGSILACGTPEEYSSLLKRYTSFKQLIESFK